MATTNPLHLLREAVTGAVTHPVATAGKAVGHARGAVVVGGRLAGQVVAGAVGLVADRFPGADDASSRPAARPVVRPVVVPDPTPSPAPVTSIDEAADPAQVDATPADVAKAVARKSAPARKTAPAKKAPAAKKSAPATKAAPPRKTSGTPTATPSAKLPPRRPSAETRGD